MSKANNLTDFLTDIADTIRTKSGTSSAINPQNFSSKITSLNTAHALSKTSANAYYTTDANNTYITLPLPISSSTSYNQANQMWVYQNNTSSTGLLSFTIKSESTGLISYAYAVGRTATVGNELVGANINSSASVTRNNGLTTLKFDRPITPITSSNTAISGAVWQFKYSNF